MTETKQECNYGNLSKDQLELERKKLESSLNYWEKKVAPAIVNKIRRELKNVRAELKTRA